MAIRQYIGARYVLKIYENSLDPQSADWESGVAYESLVMVNYNNSSYISRKNVPANIGDPVSNPSYWALSGLYNGQIANLQNEIGSLGTLETRTQDNLVDAINSITTKNIVVIGDSYSRPSYVPAGKEWYNLLASREGYTIYNYSVGGSGFVNHQAGSVYIADEITNAVNGVPNPDLIDVVILYAGLNDFNLNVTESDIYSGAVSAIQQIKTDFQYAKIIYIPFNYGYGSALTAKHMEFLAAMTQAGKDESVFTYEYMPAMFSDKSFTAYLTSNHPNEAGNEREYQIISNLLKGNNTPPTFYYRYSPTEWNGTTVLSRCDGYIKLQGFDAEIYLDFDIQPGTYSGVYRAAAPFKANGNTNNIGLDWRYDGIHLGDTDLVSSLNALVQNNNDSSLRLNFQSSQTIADTKRAEYKFEFSIVRPKLP